MEVIAEIVSPDVLEQVRAEESDYVRGRSKSGAVMPQGRANQQRQAAAAPMPGMPDPMAAPLPPLQPLPGANQPAGMATPRQTAPEPAAMPGAAPAPMPVPAAGRPAPVACQLTDKASGKTWRIACDSTVIGRDEAHADLVLGDSNVSRRHAELTRNATGWRIADLGSTNGTRVNGMRVSEQDLANGDTITMGLVTLMFEEV